MTKLRGPGRRLLIGAPLLLVRASGQFAGLLLHGSWPSVFFLWSFVELVHVVTGRDARIAWWASPAGSR